MFDCKTTGNNYYRALVTRGVVQVDKYKLVTVPMETEYEVKSVVGGHHISETIWTPVTKILIAAHYRQMQQA